MAVSTWKRFLGAAVAGVAAVLLLAAPPAGAETAAVHRDLDYTLDPAVGTDPLRRLDLYQPPVAPGDLRPVVIYAHGGGWMDGDKSNRMTDMPRLFNDAGYLFASVNYRLSPDISAGPLPPAYSAGRLTFPDHPRDLAEAVAWIGRNAAGYGGDPDALILVGHSAGAHLVSLVGSDPSYLANHGASLRQVVGVVSLDAGAMDVVESATQRGSAPTANEYLIWNAFGTPAEEAASPRWLRASPVAWGDPSDPRSLMVTQAARPARIADNAKMAAALGQDPASVLRVPLDHEGIGRELGSPSDSTGETAAVMTFVADRIASRVDPVVRIRRRPAKVVRVGGNRKKRKVAIAFAAAGASRVECRIDRGSFGACRSPKVLRLKRGGHRVSLRALYPSGRPGPVKTIGFRIVSKRR